MKNDDHSKFDPKEHSEMYNDLIDMLASNLYQRWSIEQFFMPYFQERWEEAMAHAKMKMHLKQLQWLKANQKSNDYLYDPTRETRGYEVDKES